MNKKLKELSGRRPWAKKQERQGRGRKQQDKVKFTFNPPISKKLNAQLNDLSDVEYSHKLVTAERQS